MVAHVWVTVGVYVHLCTSATQGHCKCTRGHYDMMCAYVTLRGLIDYYIRYGSRVFALSVCDINGRER